MIFYHYVINISLGAIIPVQYSIDRQAEHLENIIDRRVIEITNLILPDEDIKLFAIVLDNREVP